MMHSGPRQFTEKRSRTRRSIMALDEASMTRKAPGPDEPQYSADVQEWFSGNRKYGIAEWQALSAEHLRQFAEWERRKRRPELPGMLLEVAGNSVQTLFYITLVVIVVYHVGQALGCRMVTRPWWM
jgi:hypothetical protein